LNGGVSRDDVLRPFRPLSELRIDYERELNPQQRAAVMAPPGPALVIAGAGAGKTRTLIYRVAFLLEQGIPPDRILLLTFTNKAAREMMRRVMELLGGDLAALWGGTFHAVGHRILRQQAEVFGLSRQFTILDRDDQTQLLKTCVAEAGVGKGLGRLPKPEVLADLFSLAANTRQGLAALLERQYDYLSHLLDPLRAIKAAYDARKRSNDTVDFDDLLELWLGLLEERPEECEAQQRRFQFVLVDEYQDTNRLQGDIVDLLAARHHNVMAVGDDAQSIYSWRGADFHNIFTFADRHPGATVYSVETNYRSTPEILDLANAVIAGNVRQFPKQLTPVRASGARPVKVNTGTAGEQAAFVAQRILKLREEGVELSEIAVLYRSHFHALDVQLELTRHGLPFTITSGLRIFELAHVKDVVAYLKFICNPRDELALNRLLRLLPGIGGGGAQRLWQAYQAHAPKPDSGPVRHAVATALQACVSRVPPKSAVAYAQFVATIGQLEDAWLKGSSTEMIRRVLEAGYDDYLKTEYANYRSRRDDLEQLGEFARQFDRPEEFLGQLALLTNLEAEAHGPKPEESDQVRLSTVHQAKGLEFAVVFVIMLCEELFPSRRSLEILGGEEEERRLFYVAVTRARNELYLCWPSMWQARGRSGSPYQQPSRFLRELPEAVREDWDLRREWERF
jgi:DNA helicase-2/ATP-dependent DNA helicase PcrA